MSIIWLLLGATLWAILYFAVRSVARRSLLFTRHVPLLAEIIGASGLLALAAVGFFWQILLTSNTWMPAGGGDLAPFLYPNYRFAAEYLRQGVIPLWNPHLYSGTPFAADIQSGLFYPINLLVFLGVPNLTYEWLEYLAIFHFWLAGTTMYVCLRMLNFPSESPISQSPNLQSSNIALGKPLNADAHNPPHVSPLAAFAGALAFQFSDLFIVHFGNLNMIAVAAWLPLIFLLFHLSLRRSSLGLAAASGVVLAIATLAGHIQITLFILLTLGLYTVFTIYDLRFTIKSSLPNSQIPSDLPNRNYVTRTTHYVSLLTPYSSLLTPLFSLLITLLVTIGLAALLLFPAYEMSQYTPRAKLPYSEAARYSLHPVQVAGLFVPNYFGRDPALHWGPWERVETGYIGLMTLILAIAGLLLCPGRLKFFFMGLGLIAWLLAMGGYSVMHGWLYAIVPGFNQLRAPARFILLLDFSLAALAAFGLNQLLHLNNQAQEKFAGLLKVLTWSLGGLIVMALPLSYFAMLITQDRNPTIFNRAVGAASGVATFALFAIASLVVLHLIRSRWLRERWAGIVIILVIGLDLFTLGQNVDVGYTNPVAGFDHPETLAFLQNDPNLFRIEVTTDVWHAWQPNTALLNNLYDAWGLYNPLTLAYTTLYWSAAPPRSSPRYNFLGIKYVIASKAGAPADGQMVPVFDADPQVNVYLNQQTLAPVQFVGQANLMPDHAAAWDALFSEDFDPTTMVILEAGQPLNTQPASTLAILQHDLHAVTIAVDTDQPGYLVLPDAYYPGWQAAVDNQPAPIHRANYAFRAVYVPEGQHTVQFVFNPLIWKVGLMVSGATLLGMLVWVYFKCIKTKLK